MECEGESTMTRSRRRRKLGDSAGSSDQQHTLQQLSKVLQNSINKGDAAITLGATISASGAMLVVFTVLSAGSMMALVVMGAGAALSWRGLRRRGLMALLPEGVQQQLTQTTLLEWLTDTSFMDNMKPYLLFCLGPNTEETRLFLKFLPPAMRQRLTRPGLLHCLPEGVSSLLLPADDGAAQSHNNNDDDEQQQQQRQQQQRRRRQLQLPAFQHAAAESEGGEDSSDSEADSDSEVQDLESFEDSGGLVWTPLSPPCAASRAALGSPMAHGTPPHGVQHERDNPSSPDTSANATAAPSPFGGSETSAAARGAAAAAVTGAAADPAEHPTQQLRSIRSSSGSSSAGAVHDHPIAAAASPDASSVHGGDDNSGFSGSGATPTVEDLAWLLVRNRVRSAWDAVWGIVDKDAAGVVGGAAAALLAVHLGVSARARQQAKAMLSALAVASCAGVAVAGGSLALARHALPTSAEQRQRAAHEERSSTPQNAPLRTSSRRQRPCSRASLAAYLLKLRTGGDWRNALSLALRVSGVRAAVVAAAMAAAVVLLHMRRHARQLALARGMPYGLKGHF